MMREDFLYKMIFWGDLSGKTLGQRADTRVRPYGQTNNSSEGKRMNNSPEGKPMQNQRTVGAHRCVRPPDA